jgi:hypothetical protein
MAITLQTILATNSFSASRIIINNNFTAIKTSIDALEGYLSSSTGALSVTSGYIERGSNPTSTTIFTCEASGIFGGNLSIGGSTGLTTTALTASNGVTVTGGDILLTNASRKVEVSGKMVMDSEIVLKDYGDGFLDAADEASYDPANVSTISAGVHKQAVISVVGVHSLLMDFSTYDTVAGKIVKSFTLPTGNTVGQIIEIVVKTAAISGIYMDKTNIANLTGTQKVYFTNSPYDYQSVQLRWTGTTWILMNVLGATIS